jgi:hypothetical protein
LQIPSIEDCRLKIPSFGTKLVTVAVYSSVIKMFKSVYGLHGSEELKFRLYGKLRVSGDSTFATTLPFESAGEVTLKDSEKLELK